MNLAKIKEIIHSHIIQLNPTEEQREKAEHRLGICMGNEEKKIPKCEFWVLSDTYSHCQKCGCGTAKAFSPALPPPCPEGKWEM